MPHPSAGDAHVISNHRLIDINGGEIIFYGKSYKKGGIKEQIKLPADEFIRRFLLHILPKRFRKIRYGGFLAQAIRKDKLEIARQQLTYATPMDEIELDIEDIELDKIEKCPQCHIGIMRAIDIDLNFKRNKWQIYNDSS